MSRQVWPLGLMLEKHNLQPTEVPLLDQFSPIPLLEQLYIVRAGLPISLLRMATQQRSAA